MEFVTDKAVKRRPEMRVGGRAGCVAAAELSQIAMSTESSAMDDSLRVKRSWRQAVMME
jgi:hypothetical protein